MPDRNSADVKEVAAALRQLRHMVTVLEDHYRRYIALDDAFREYAAGMQERIDKVERGLAILLTRQEAGTHDPALEKITGQLSSELIGNHLASLKRQIVTQYKNLNDLKEDAAQYGTQPPLYIRNQIREIRLEIKKLEEELEYFKGL